MDDLSLNVAAAFPSLPSQGFRPHSIVPDEYTPMPDCSCLSGCLNDPLLAPSYISSFLASAVLRLHSIVPDEYTSVPDCSCLSVCLNPPLLATSYSSSLLASAVFRLHSIVLDETKSSQDCSCSLECLDASLLATSYSSSLLASAVLRLQCIVLEQHKSMPDCFWWSMNLYAPLQEPLSPSSSLDSPAPRPPSIFLQGDIHRLINAYFSTYTDALHQGVFSWYVLPSEPSSLLPRSSLFPTYTTQRELVSMPILLMSFRLLASDL